MLEEDTTQKRDSDLPVDDRSADGPTVAPDSTVVVRRVDHVAVMVVDLERVIDWYVSVVGATVSDRWQDSGVGMRWAHLDLAGTRVEFVQRSDLDRGSDRATGLHHVALEVADCGRSTDELVAAGASVVMAPSYFERHDMDWSFVSDPFGNTLEIISYRTSSD